jgi:hypothetical protein
MNELTLSILTKQKIDSVESGKCMMNSLCESAPEFLPEKIGNCEPLRDSFDSQRFTELWTDPFLWKHKKPRCEGSAWFHSSVLHSNLHLDLLPSHGKPQFDYVQAMARLLNNWTQLLRPDFGYVHLLSATEIAAEKATKLGTVTALDPANRRHCLTVTSHTLKKYIPELYWVTVFGAPYVELFGRERLINAPAFLAEEIADGIVQLQLTKDIEDLESRPEEVARRRMVIKEYLGSDAFFNPVRSHDAQYQTPEFSF